MIPFTFTHPDFANVARLAWYPSTLTFVVIITFIDGATVTADLSGVGFDVLYQAAKLAHIPIVELCHFCKQNPANPRWTTDGDTIIICDACAEVEEF